MLALDLDNRVTCPGRRPPKGPWPPGPQSGYRSRLRSGTRTLPEPGAPWHLSRTARASAANCPNHLPPAAPQARGPLPPTSTCPTCSAPTLAHGHRNRHSSFSGTGLRLQGLNKPVAQTGPPQTPETPQWATQPSRGTHCILLSSRASSSRQNPDRQMANSEDSPTATGSDPGQGQLAPQPWPSWGSVPREPEGIPSPSATRRHAACVNLPRNKLPGRKKSNCVSCQDGKPWFQQPEAGAAPCCSCRQRPGDSSQDSAPHPASPPQGAGLYWMRGPRHRPPASLQALPPAAQWGHRVWTEARGRLTEAGRLWPQ